MGAFPLLYSYEEGMFDLPEFLEAAQAGGASSDANENPKSVRKLTCTQHVKHSLYTDKILQDSAPLFQKWMLRIIAKIENMRLKLIDPIK